MLSPNEADTLLDVLCTKLGFCLPPTARTQLTENPPADVGAFTDAVFVAEGLDPATADLRTYRDVKATVAEAFRQSADRRDGQRRDGGDAVDRDP